MTTIEKISFADVSAIDLLPLLNRKMQEAGITSGICSIQALCPECCVLAADPDPRAIEDVLDDFKRVIPATADYQSDKDPRLTAAYTRCSIIGSNRDIPVEEGRLLLGGRQGLYLFNFYGSGEKEVAVTFIS